MDDRAAVIKINRCGVFRLEEAQQILPVVRRITQEFSAKVDLLMARLESLNVNQTEQICAIEEQINQMILTWNEKIKKLGAVPKGLWVVDFDFGQGYYCWKYPETDIFYWHLYQDGYTGRRPLSELIGNMDINEKNESPLQPSYSTSAD